MAYEIILNTITSRRYHSYLDKNMNELQKLFNTYVAAASQLDSQITKEKHALKHKLDNKELGIQQYSEQLNSIDERYKNNYHAVQTLLRNYETAVESLEAEYYGILLTDGRVHAVVNRNQTSPHTKELDSLYQPVLTAKAELAALLTQQQQLRSYKGLNYFIQTYLKNSSNKQQTQRFNIALENKASALVDQTTTIFAKLATQQALTNPKLLADEREKIQEDLAELIEISEINEQKIDSSNKILAHGIERIAHITQTELDLKVEQYRAKLASALTQIPLEQLIKNFNDSYRKFIERASIDPKNIIQDINGQFYEDILTRDIETEIAMEKQKLTTQQNKEKLTLLERQLVDQRMIQAIDKEYILTGYPTLTGVKEFTITLRIDERTINWIISGPSDQSTETFRRIIANIADHAHSMTDGCSGSYQGSEPSNIKQKYSHISETGVIHNHYEFTTAITPDILRNYLNAAMVQLHGDTLLNAERKAIGQEVYLTSEHRQALVDKIVASYSHYYDMPKEALSLSTDAGFFKPKSSDSNTHSKAIDNGNNNKSNPKV